MASDHWREAIPFSTNVCLRYMLKFIRESWSSTILVGGIAGMSDSELLESLRPAAEMSTRLPVAFPSFPRHLCMQLSILPLFDTVILIDDTSAIEFEEQGRRQSVLIEILQMIVRLYGALSGSVRAIRFANSDEEFGTDDYSKERISRIIECHDFEGVTRLGNALMEKILAPFMFAGGEGVMGVRNVQPLARPLLAVVITDGIVDGEPPGQLERVIQIVQQSVEASCQPREGLYIAVIGHEHSRADSLGGLMVAVRIQFVGVGYEEDQRHLDYLANHSTVSNMVTSCSMRNYIREGKEEIQLMQKIVSVLLGPYIPMWDIEEITGKAAERMAAYESEDDLDE